MQKWKLQVAKIYLIYEFIFIFLLAYLIDMVAVETYPGYIVLGVHYMYKSWVY